MRDLYKNRVLFVILVASLMVITQCEESSVVQDHTDRSGQKTIFQKAFNSNEFDAVISFDFKVNWETETKGYSEELETVYYEYLIELENVLYGNSLPLYTLVPTKPGWFLGLSGFSIFRFEFV